ncbi:hypothetical protein V1527DRAFT_477834 [Lipomyces starkeyi]
MVYVAVSNKYMTRGALLILIFSSAILTVLSVYSVGIFSRKRQGLVRLTFGCLAFAIYVMRMFG